jgi:hypothetical protein
MNAEGNDKKKKKKKKRINGSEKHKQKDNKSIELFFVFILFNQKIKNQQIDNLPKLLGKIPKIFKILYYLTKFAIQSFTLIYDNINGNLLEQLSIFENHNRNRLSSKWLFITGG